MSKVKIQGSASGNGTLTIQAPTTSTDRTINIPDSSGTLLDENSSVPAANLTGTIADARFPATLPAASAANLTAIPAANITGALPAISGASLTAIPAANLTGSLPSGMGGKILQVKETTAHSVVASNPSSYTTLYALTITPSSASNKILVTAMVGGLYLNYGGSVNQTNWRLARGSTACTGATSNYHTEVGRNNTGTGSRAYINMQVLDEPNTTSATTYNVQVIRQNGSGGISIGDTSGTSTLTLMEIGA
jgi:hypothetical protein